MIFGDIPTEEAAGAILAHTVRTENNLYKKGRILSESDVAQILSEGRKNILVAKLEKDDVHEDEAAKQLAEFLVGDNIRQAKTTTGRCNLYAKSHGLVWVNSEGLTEANLIDESLTTATLPHLKAVAPGELVGTAKIIPFSVPQNVMAKLKFFAQKETSILEVKPFLPFTLGLVITKLPNTKKSILDKSANAIRNRLKKMGNRLSMVVRCNHDKDSVAEAIKGMEENHCDIILVFGPSATVDRRDVIPSGFEKAGGTVEVFGIPVDPGNLLLLGKLRKSKLVGVPGCARSLALNGFDFVLQRLLAGLEISRVDIAQMGLGGLLKEPPNRPQPRE